MENHLAYLLNHYGYLGILIAMSGGMIGLPFPDEVLMAFVGYHVYNGTMSYFLSIASAFFGTSVGISFSYLLGYKLGLPFLKKYGPKIHITEDKIEKTHQLFLRYGNIWITLGYFIPGVRHINGFLAGIANLEFHKFGLFAYTGAFLWSITFLTLGYYLGEDWYLIKKVIGHYREYFFLGLVLILAAGLLIYFLVNKYKNKKQ